MNADEVKALPMTEKVQIMEALWEDLRDRFERMEVPQSHKDLLDQRRSRVERGESQLHEWDEVKSSIGRR